MLLAPNVAGYGMHAITFTVQFSTCVVDCRPEELCLTFTCSNGLGPEVDLEPGGSEKEVTSANWRSYCDLLLAYKLQKSIQPEVDAVRKGLQHLVDDRTMQLLHR